MAVAHAAAGSATLHGRRRISADTALRLGRYFGVSEQSWLNLDDLETERDKIGDALEKITPDSAPR